MVIKILTHHYHYMRATPEKRVSLAKGLKNVFIKAEFKENYAQKPRHYQKFTSKRTIK